MIANTVYCQSFIVYVLLSVTRIVPALASNFVSRKTPRFVGVFLFCFVFRR